MSRPASLEDLLVEERRAASLGWLAQEGGPCRVKLCGMYRDEDIAALNACQPDLCGFIFAFPKSHRNVGRETIERLLPRVDERIYRVMVLVDQRWQVAAYYTALEGVDMLQLHGHEDNDYIAHLRTKFRGGIIQAFRMRGQADVERALASTADMVLLDAGQGSGETFDWSLVEGFGARRPFILAGGLAPGNVAEAIAATHPWGVDMSSGIETNRKKDPDKMAAAVAAVRSAS